MQRLPGSDAIFLSIEGPNAHVHTGALTVIDPTGSKGFGLKKLQETLEKRIHQVPKLSWHLREVPMGIDLPYWEEGIECNIADHIHHVSLPKPGDRKALARLAGELFSRPLDRSRPLWEIWYIDGLQGKRVAILMKMHHCLFDGVAGAGLGEILADLTPEPGTEKPKPDQPEIDYTRQYSDLELYARGWYALLGMPYRLVKMGTSLGLDSVKKWPQKYRAKKLRNGCKAPRASFNAPLGSSRALVFSTVSLTKIKTIKNHYKLTVNDVVLAVCAGAIRRYLLAQNSLPGGPLVAGVPMSTRSKGDRSMDNQVGSLSVSLQTHIENPVERLQSIHELTINAKKAAALVGPANIQGMGSILPPVAIELLGWIAKTTKIENLLPVTVNTIISNVPGPSFPLYLCGGKIEALYPLAPILMGMGFNITVMSYQDEVNFGFVLDPHLVPEPWYLAEGIEVALDELVRSIKS